MKIRLLLGSVGAVIILILVSFTNVVGIQSTTFDSINDSPLFNIRTNMAIKNENNGVLTSDFLGKGINTLLFPLRDNRTAMIQKFIQRIRTMDDATFNNFITMIIRIIQKEPTFHNVNTQEKLAVLYQLKNNQNILLNKDIDFNHKALATSDLSNPICDLLNKLWWLFAILYLYIGLFILTILQPGKCYDSLWGTCLLNSK